MRRDAKMEKKRGLKGIKREKVVHKVHRYIKDIKDRQLIKSAFYFVQGTFREFRVIWN